MGSGANLVTAASVNVSRVTARASRFTKPCSISCMSLNTPAGLIKVLVVCDFGGVESYE